MGRRLDPSGFRECGGWPRTRARRLRLSSFRCTGAPRTVASRMPPSGIRDFQFGDPLLHEFVDAAGSSPPCALACVDRRIDADRRLQHGRAVYRQECPPRTSVSVMSRQASSAVDDLLATPFPASAPTDCLPPTGCDVHGLLRQRLRPSAINGFASENSSYCMPQRMHAAASTPPSGESRAPARRAAQTCGTARG